MDLWEESEKQAPYQRDGLLLAEELLGKNHPEGEESDEGSGSGDG